MPKNPLHSVASPEWYTPLWLVQAARLVLTDGRIRTDPATTPEANRVVQATHIYTAERSGLDREAVWPGPVFVNPPSGLVREFWTKLLQQRDLLDHPPHRYEAIWVGYSLEQLAMLQRFNEHPLQHSVCVLHKRVKFDRPAGQPKAGSPTHSNYICGINIDRHRFHEVFSAFGACVEPMF